MSDVADLQARLASLVPRPAICPADGLGTRAGAVDGTPGVRQQYRRFAAGSELFAQDVPNGDVFTVVEGWVLLHHILEDGRRQILAFLLPGDICGLAPPGGGPAPHTAEALTDVTVMTLSRTQFAVAVAADADRAVAVMERLSETVSWAHETMVDIGRRAAMEAVASLLFRLERRIREASGAPEGATVDFPPTQEQLGDALGLSAAHVCRTLRVLRERRILSLRRHKLQVHDPAALRRMLVREDPILDNGNAA